MKISVLANYIKKLFKINDGRNNLSTEEIIALDYFECICYLYNGNEKPVVYSFKDGVNIWLTTSVGTIEFDEIPHSKSHLTNNVYELEALIGENNLDEDYVIKLINSKIDESWK